MELSTWGVQPRSRPAGTERGFLECPAAATKSALNETSRGPARRGMQHSHTRHLRRFAARQIQREVSGITVQNPQRLGKGGETDDTDLNPRFHVKHSREAHGHGPGGFSSTSNQSASLQTGPVQHARGSAAIAASTSSLSRSSALPRCDARTHELPSRRVRVHDRGLQSCARRRPVQQDSVEARGTQHVRHPEFRARFHVKPQTRTGSGALPDARATSTASLYGFGEH